jgi:hypothetical protein
MSRIKSAKPKIVGNEITPVGNGDGKFGRGIQKAYDDAGIKTNHGVGPDLPQYENKEIKSRVSVTNAAVTIGTAKISDIIESNGKIFLDKLQKWDFHTHENQVVTKTENLDFAKMQDSIKEELANLAKQLEKGITSSGYTLAKTETFIVERAKENDNRYGKLRIKGNKFEGFKGLSKSTFYDHFE